MDLPYCDIVISGGRVIDPRHSIDAELEVGISSGRVVYLGEETPDAPRVIDAAGHIVAPGFIDLHSHAQNLTGHRLQALDGVTTSLELESGAAPITAALGWSQGQGRPLHYGYSAGWLHSRIIVMEGLNATEIDSLPPLPLEGWASLQDRTAWREPASAEQISEIVRLVEEQLDRGALGIGLLLGYCPDSSDEELEAIARLAADRGVPLFVHARYGSTRGLNELIQLARSTGVQVHLCHFASTNSSSIDESAALISQAQAEGLRFTTESYPFGMASTVIGATFLSPDSMKARNAPTSRIILLESGEEIASYERLAELRAQDPGSLVLLRTYDEEDPAKMADLQRALTLPGAAFASDAMPVQATSAGEQLFDDVIELSQWPLPARGLAVHPRSSSTFVRGISWLHRDSSVIGLSDAIARCSTIPAEILRSCGTEFHRKGHLGVGADADVVVFDLDRLEPNTDFTRVQPSRGMTAVLVDGVEVVAAGELRSEALSGRAMLG